VDSTDPITAPAATAAELVRIRSLLRQRNFAAALEAARALLAHAAPGQRDALLFVAIAQRHLGRIPDALAALAALEQHYPRFSRLHEERGQCHVAMRQAPQAIESFLAAVNMNNALPASWSMLEGLYRMTGRPDDAENAASQVATLRNIPSEVVSATSLYLDGDLDIAEPMVRGYLLKHGDQIEAMRLLARIGIARKVFDDAELLLSAVLKIAPGYRAARTEYAETLIELHREAEARVELEQLIREDPQNRLYYQAFYATACVGLGQHERAIGLYQELLSGTPADADVHLSIAHAQKTLGQQEVAIASYRSAAACRPGFGDAYWSLANLKTYRFTPEELEAMRALQADPALGDIDRLHLSFALGKALEDQGEFAESFHYYELGNRLKRAASRYQPEIIENNTRQQIAVCTAEFFGGRRDWGVPDPDPIFIVGLPRSGSTLLEQILASHSQVEGTHELPDIQRIVATLRGREPDPSNPHYPRVLAELSAAEARQLGQRYLDATRAHRTGKLLFIDKMPNNFRHLGLIRLILPNAKIVDARREPLACCFSNFKQLFARGQEFTYSFDDIARYYRTYLELMRHWDQVLPGWVMRVQHEDVVDDLEGNVRRILEFCGLGFEPQCVEFHKTVRSVRTASSEQVRQPIFRAGLEQWRNFEPWLTPLIDSLGDAARRYRN
jgi:tetratricopeptide (TPR) repeat protein